MLTSPRMPVSMAKTPNHASGKALSTKVPFKKVFSSSHLQTNGASGGQSSAESRSQHGRGSRDYGHLAHPNLSNQLSSSLPGILDNVNSNQPRRATGGTEMVASTRSSQKASSSGYAVIESVAKATPAPSPIVRTGAQAIPLSAIEPSMIVSLSTYLAALRGFDSDKLIKEIQNVLIYFEGLVGKSKPELVVGACTILLEAVDGSSLKLKNAYLQLHQVHLRLQLLLQSFNLDDDSDALGKIRRYGHSRAGAVFSPIVYD